MIYLSGAVRPEVLGIGFMVTPKMGNRIPEGRIWAADNGRYADPESYSDEGFLAWLGARSSALCLFATAPDVVGDHASTLKLSLPILPRIRATGYKAAFVAQNGISDPPWDAFDCLFIGGDDEFKLGPAVPRLVSEAKRRGKWAHMGRVNSMRRLRLAATIGCDSADGTFLKFGPIKNTPRLIKWLLALQEQPSFSYPEIRREPDRGDAARHPAEAASLNSPAPVASPTLPQGAGSSHERT